MTRQRAILYLRVSTEEQAEGTSLDIQLEQTSAYAKALGYEVVGGSGTG